MENDFTWHYSWVQAIETPAAERAGEIEPQLYHIFIRTQWEPKADGISKPHTEMLAFLFFNPFTKVYNTHFMGTKERKWLVTTTVSDAKLVVENYYKFECTNQDVYGS